MNITIHYKVLCSDCGVNTELLSCTLDGLEDYLCRLCLDQRIDKIEALNEQNEETYLNPPPQVL